MIKKFKFANGLRVVMNTMSNRESVAIGIWIRVGGRYETSKIKGISHYLEHLLFKGSKKYSCRKIKESIEGVGGSLNGFTSEELTCYLAKLPARHLDLALDVLSDMVLNPLLPEEEIERERTVILEELKMYKDLPQSYVLEILDGLLWPNHPLGAAIIGTEDSIRAINKNSLSRFQKDYYIPAQTVISLTGNFKPDAVLKKIKNIFSQSSLEKRFSFLPAQEKQDGPKIHLLRKDTEQTHLALGFHGLRRDDPRRYALGLLHIILGANMSSRLFNEVREKRGLAYEIATALKRFEDTGAFIVHAGLDNRNLKEAVKIILEQLGRVKEELVSLDEFKRAKDYYLGQLSLSLEDTLDYMLWLGESVASLDRFETYRQVKEQVNNITRADLKEIAQFIFRKEKLNLALISSIKEEELDLKDVLQV